MINNTNILPEGYCSLRSVDLQKDKKAALLVNGIAVMVMVLLIILGQWIVSIETLFDMSAGAVMYFLRFGGMVLGYVVYMLLHELTHGVMMKYYGAKKIKYGFTGLYAYAGCDHYFNKTSYIVIALAPVVLLGVVLLVINLLVPVSWFWVVYFIQTGNLAGAAGDIYVTCLFARMPKDILVRDSGVSMTVYALPEKT